MAEELVTVQEGKTSNDRVRLGTIAGLPFFFNYSFLVWFVFVIFVPPINLVLFISLLFFSISIHELAHALANRYLGLGSGTLTIWFLGGFFIPFSDISPGSIRTSQRIKYALVVLAGPLSNLVLAGLFLLAAYATSMNLLYMAAQYNLFLALFNLLPIGYLDGGNLLRYLGSIMVDWRKITFFSGILSIALAVTLFVGTFFWGWLGDYARWVGFFITMGIGTIRMTRETDEQLRAESKKTIERELRLTQTTSESKESTSFLSWTVKVGLAGLILFSIGYLFNQYWTYRDLSGHIVFTDDDKRDRGLHLYITQKLGFPTVDAEGAPALSYSDWPYLTNPEMIAFPCESAIKPWLTNICIDNYSGRRIGEIPVGVKEIRSLVLSPDASRLAFSTFKEGVYVAEISSGDIEKIYDQGTVAAWSPDGNDILVTVKVDGNMEIFRINPLDENAVNLTNNPLQDHFPVYTDDGEYIYFLSDRDGKYDLFRMDHDGSHMTKIGLENQIHPSGFGLRLSPDNTRLLFSCGWGDSICVANTDGTDERVLAKADRAAWSPDGKYVVVSGFHQDAIFIVTSDGKQSVHLKSLEFITENLIWLP